MIIIHSHRKNIVATNYWTLPDCKEQFYMSFNAGACRILLPQRFQHYLRDMKTSKQRVITFGEYSPFGDQMAYEVLFDDHSDRPFSMATTLGAVDRYLSDTDHGEVIELSVWLPKSSREPEKARCVFRRKAVIRIGPILGREAWRP